MRAKIIIISTIIIFAGAGILLFFLKGENTPKISEEKNQDKIYVAAEESGEIDVISVKDRAVMDKINLSTEMDGMKMSFYPHNVQVAPDNKTVWVTANAYLMNTNNQNMSGMNMIAGDEIVVIDPLKDEIIKRIKIGASLHLSHIVLTPDSKYAIAIAQTKGVIFKINAETYQVEKEINTEEGAEPHGVRISPDGKTAYVAFMGGKSMGILDIEKMTLSYVPLKGKAIQTGITPDGKYALTSIYYKPSLAVYEISSAKLSYIDLPEEALGLVQIYPTPDSRFVYAADQGYFFNQFPGKYVYKIDLGKMKASQKIKVGSAPHGVAVSRDGKFVYVTNMLSNDLSIIDAVNDEQIAKVKVGRTPNGVSLFYGREYLQILTAQ